MGDFGEELGPLHAPGPVGGIYQVFGCLVHLLMRHGETKADIIKAVKDTPTVAAFDADTWKEIEQHEPSHTKQPDG